MQDALEKDAQIKGLSQDLVEQQEELKTLQTEFKELKELAEQGGLGSQQPSEELKAELATLSQKLTDAEDKLDDVAKESAELKEQFAQKEQEAAAVQYASLGQVDSKMQALLEKLKVNNQVEWKQTVQAAEKEFSA